MEKIQIPEYLSLYGGLKDFFGIMGKNNEITGNKRCKSVCYTFLHVLLPVIFIIFT